MNTPVRIFSLNKWESTNVNASEEQIREARRLGTLDRLLGFQVDVLILESEAASL